MKLTLIRQQPETHDTISFFWRPEAKFDYQSGQFLKWSLPHEGADDRGTTRFFSISSSPTEEGLRLTTKFNAERSSSFKAHLKTLQTGDTIEADGPRGEFVLPEATDQAVVLVAGGIGITPYRSMIRCLADRDQKRPAQLLYAARSLEDFVFKAEIDQLAEPTGWQVVYIPEAPSATWDGPTGRLDAQKIKELSDGLDGKLVYLSGPKPMIEAFKTQLLEAGVPDAQIKTDYFPGYTQI